MSAKYTFTYRNKVQKRILELAKKGLKPQDMVSVLESEGIKAPGNEVPLTASQIASQLGHIRNKHSAMKQLSLKPEPAKSTKITSEILDSNLSDGTKLKVLRAVAEL